MVACLLSTLRRLSYNYPLSPMPKYSWIKPVKWCSKKQNVSAVLTVNYLVYMYQTFLNGLKLHQNLLFKM